MKTGVEITCKEIQSKAYKVFVENDGVEVGRAFIFLITNDLNNRPYGILEDVFVTEEFRSQGIGSELVKAIIAQAKELGCYKLIATSRYSRPKVHELYKRLGFKDHGKEFRMDF